MDLEPIIKIQYLASDLQFGLMQQPTHPFSEDVTSLLGQVTDTSGFLLEQNTASLLFAPKIRYQDFGASVTHSGGDQGKWRQTWKRSTQKNILLQYNSTQNTVWDVTSPADQIPFGNMGFVVDLYGGASPKVTDMGKTIDDYPVNRQIIWPRDGAGPSGMTPGDNIYRVTLGYQIAPFLEITNDGSAAITANTANWKRLGEIPCPIDLSKLQTSDGIDVTLSVMVKNNALLVWLGQGFNRFTLAVTGGSYKSGTIEVSGQNGYTGIGFGLIRYPLTATMTAPYHFGPADMTHAVHFQLIGQIPSGTTATAAIGTIDTPNNQFNFTITFTATADGVDTNYANFSPCIQYINGQWDPLWVAPSSGPWVDIDNKTILKYEGRISWDPDTRIMIRSFRVRVTNYNGEWRTGVGIQAIRIFTGYKHMAGQTGFDAEGFCLAPRAYAIGNDSIRLSSNGPHSFAEFTATDAMYILADATLQERIFPAQNCVYALAHLLFECGGIVPNLTTNIPRCTLGMSPTVIATLDGISYPTNGHAEGDPCPHTIFGAHPEWAQNIPVLSCFGELMKAEYATMGQDLNGQMVFARFDPTAAYTIRKVFSEGGTGDGENYDHHVSEGYNPLAMDGLIRTRSLDSVRNQIIVGGLDQDTGAPFAVSYNDAASISGSRLGANYLGFVRRWMDLWSGYDTKSFATQVLQQMAQWARLPDERIADPVLGQPDWQPLMVFLAQESRTLGFDTGIYFTTDVLEVFEAPYDYYALLIGRWTGAFTPDGSGGFNIGQPPGVA